MKAKGEDPTEFFNDDKETEIKGRFFAPLIGGTHKDEKDAVNDEMKQRDARKKRTRRNKAAEEDETEESIYPPQVWIPGMPLARKAKEEEIFYRAAPPTTRYVEKAKVLKSELEWNQQTLAPGPIHIDAPGSGGPFDALNHPARLIHHFERNFEGTMDGWDGQAMGKVPVELLRKLSESAKARLPSSLQEALQGVVALPTTAPVQGKKGTSKKRAAPAAASEEGRKSKRARSEVAGGAALLEHQENDVQVMRGVDFPLPSIEQPAASAETSGAVASTQRVSGRLAANRAASEAGLTDEVATAPAVKRQKKTDAEPAVASSVRAQSSTGGRKVKRVKNNSACKACAKAHRGCKGPTCPYRTDDERKAVDTPAPSGALPVEENRLEAAAANTTNPLPSLSAALDDNSVDLDDKLPGLLASVAVPAPSPPVAHPTPAITNPVPEQEETFVARPSVRIPLPDHLKNILVDDWENVTKSQLLVPLPSKAPANFIIDSYFAEEKHNRRLDTPEANILEEFCLGLKAYFNASLPKILLYRSERAQLQEVRKWWESGKFPDWNDKQPGDCYGAEHLARMLVNMPELIAQTNMDAASVARLKEELGKFTVWLSRNSEKFFVAKYEKLESAVAG